jgi:hypothetical protein
MIKVRWLTVENRCTAADVNAYRTQLGVSMAYAKERVQDRVGPTLQYWDDEAFDSDMSSPGYGTWGCWLDVPDVTIYRGK